jgi:hypothetical protein
LLKRAGQDPIDARCAPTIDNDETRDVPKMQGTRTDNEAPADGDATMSPSGVEAAAATEADEPQRPKDAENLVAQEGGVP